MNVVAIDPGPLESALVVLESDGRVSRAVKAGNRWIKALLVELMRPPFPELAIEMVASYGMPVGAEVFETVLWTGRFQEASGRDDLVHLVKRIEVKSHLCHSGKANDANIRQAIIDRYGGKEAAIGRKAKPGPLYGVSGDEWAALAVALTVSDRLNPQIARAA